MTGFNTGDKVRLTGDKWPDRLAGTIQTISKRLNGDECFIPDDGLERHLRSGYEAELVEKLYSDFKVGDKVRWASNADYGDGEVLGVTGKDWVEVRFSEYGTYNDEKASNNKFGFDYHNVSPESLKLVRTLAEKRQDDFKVLEEASDKWRNPEHYRFPGGVQVIDITRHLSFPLGNVIKYCCRAGKKGAKLEDLQKALKYLEWAIEDAKKESE